MKGLVIKNISDSYTVLGEDNKEYILKARGIFKYRNYTLKVGDRVEFNTNAITKIENRKNDLIRPFISNLDICVIVTSLKRPDINFELLDLFLVNIESNDIKPVLLFTKIDLCDEKEIEELKEKISYYEKYYDCFYSKKDEIFNLEKLKSILGNKITVVSGQTGAGKSHFLNNLNPLLELKTQDISLALNRGKHTTRHTEIMVFDELFIADTPGFSSLELFLSDKELLKNSFPEFRELINKCKYSECSHTHEPDCIVKEKVNDGSILKSRYDSYLKFYNELKEKEKKRWK